MKALSTLRSAIDQSPSIGIIALIVMTPFLFPGLSLAADAQTIGQQPAKIFEINIADSTLLDSTPKSNDQQNQLTIEDVQNNDPLITELKAYLQKNDSPLDQYAAEIVKLPQWQRALGISFVESHMGRDCFDNNCSGIGVKPGAPTWRKYPTKLDWFVDLNKLLEKPIYKEKYDTCKKMKGVYVQPGSQGWINGCQKKYDELMAITEQAKVERQALAQKQIQQDVELATLPTLSAFDSTN